MKRESLALDGAWQFWPDAAGALTAEQLSRGTPPDGCRSIQVPGPWQPQFADLRRFSGPAWYRRLLELPAGWRDGSLFLMFGAVDYRAEVWFNGAYAGSHEGGYLPFEFDVTGLARDGANELLVRVEDPPELFAEIPHGKQSWYGGLSGIWQPVRLEQRPRHHIRRVKITPSGTQVALTVTLNRPLATGETLLCEIYDPAGAPVDRLETTDLAPTLAVPAPLLWDIDQPHLYTARVTLQSNGGSDELVEQFGFRTIAAADGQILLNGRPIYLRGALDQDYYPDLISTTPSLAYLEAQFRQAKEMGLNCLRIHIKVADPRYYIAADRAGLLVWTELPNWDRLTAASKQRGRETIAAMIERDWNHPSIVIWTIINEAWGTELQTNPDHRAWLVEMFDWVKTLDPTRLVVDNSPCFNNAHVKSDVDDFHFYAAMPDGAARWDYWVNAFAHRAPWLYGPEPEYQAHREKGAPLVVSEFGNWGLPDVARLREHYRSDPWWFETGWDWGDGDVYPHAAEERFLDLHLDKTFGDFAGLARASQWAQFEALRYQIETMRLYPQIQGYVITEFTDLHWEANGLLDLLRGPKVYHHRLAEINADTMIIPRVERRSWWSGEEAAVSLHISHYGAAPLRGAELRWSLRGEGSEEGAAASGTIAGITALPPAVVHLPPLRIVLPELDQPARLALHLQLVDAAGEVRATNELVLVAFPHAAVAPARVACPDERLAARLREVGFDVTPEPAPALPLIVTTLDDRARRFAEQGGRVLFLAETPHALQTSVPRLSLAAREKTAWSGDWASSLAWYRRDLWAGELPGDGRLDFTFAGVLPETVINSTRTMDYRQEVLAGLFVGWLRRPVALVQKRPLGEGRLLVSTLRLQDIIGREPMADILLEELLTALINGDAVQWARPWAVADEVPADGSQPPAERR